MSTGLIKELAKAEGRSEFVIALFCDIRGFSKFSTRKESPDIAMFIRRFYLLLIEKYFPDAVFHKPTGDGMLIIFRYNEYNLKEIAEKVITACLGCVNDFPTLFKNDTMINFKTPDQVGFGIARGTACCLFAGKKIIDYSGHILNLAARLTDMARPQGVVIDGDFQAELLPEGIRSEFDEMQVYIKSIAEDQSTLVYYSSNLTVFNDIYLVPIRKPSVKKFKKEFTAAQITTFAGSVNIVLPDIIHDLSSLKIKFRHPNQKVRGYDTTHPYTTFSYSITGDGPTVRVDLAHAKNLLKEYNIPSKTKVFFDTHYKS